MFRRTTFILVLLLTAGYALPSEAAEKPLRHYLMSCKSTPDIECIESITLISKTGTRVKVSEPSRYFTSLGDLELVNNREEWSFPGFTFEGSALDRIVPRFVYRPLGSDQCAFGVCMDGIEELQVGLEATWLYVTPSEEISMQMDLSRRGSQMLCGELNAPRTCRRSFNFNQDLDFEVILRMPVEFQAAAILGSVKNLEFQQNSDIKTINGNSYRNIELKFSSQTLQKVLFSNFVPHPMDTSDYADYESDAINFWVLGKRSSQVGSLGRCSSTPFITVLSNSVYQSLPRWNSITSSIEVDLQAPHYSVGGDLQKGYFEATVSKAMGKCLWGIDLSKKSEAKMSISYSGSSGPEVQTVTGRFDGENYILFSANFHYSSPTVSLILQDSSPVVAPTQTPVPLLKNIAITCYKGKLKKVVKGSNPVCPVGYKKNN